MSYPQRPTSGPQQELDSRKQQLSDISREIQSTARDIESHLATVEVYQTLLEKVEATEQSIANQLNQNPEGCTELLCKQSEAPLPLLDDIVEPVALASWSDRETAERDKVKRASLPNSAGEHECPTEWRASAVPRTNDIFFNFGIEFTVYRYGSLVQQVREWFAIAPDQALIAGAFSVGPYLSPSDAIPSLAWPYIYPPLRFVHICPPQPPFDKTTPYRIYAKTLTEKTQTLEVTWNETVISMKEKLEAVTGVPPTSLWIIYKGQKMEDDKKMEDYKIGSEAVVYILLSLRKPVIYLFLEMNLTV
ncbi:Polyubiquitin [Serendipita sp. 405]|nr:Polyubiquitin [Serendipita sp. 405]